MRLRLCAEPVRRAMAWTPLLVDGELYALADGAAAAYYLRIAWLGLICSQPGGNRMPV